ncbi:MAG: hypothetical protein AB8B53_06380 [Flavobacteriales bacterium]
MKTIKNSLLVLGSAAMFASCTVAHTVVLTNNPVGSKSKTFVVKPSNDFDISYKTLMEKADISKLSVAETKVKVFFVPKYHITLLGE